MLERWLLYMLITFNYYFHFQYGCVVKGLVKAYNYWQ